MVGPAPSPGEDGGMRIGELAARSGVSERSLRYYEAQGLIEPRRTPGGQRVYTDGDVEVVVSIQELYAAGFCSAVIRELLPVVLAPGERDADEVRRMFEAAEVRLEHEKRAIETELGVLRDLGTRLGVDPDTRVRSDSGPHGHHPTTAASDHRDRRLR
jgi:DNA-binding transcriptional MerR regulator